MECVHDALHSASGTQLYTLLEVSALAVDRGFVQQQRSRDRREWISDPTLGSIPLQLGPNAASVERDLHRRRKSILFCCP